MAPQKELINSEFFLKKRLVNKNDAQVIGNMYVWIKAKNGKHDIPIAITLILSRCDERWPLSKYKCEYSLEVPPVSVHRCYSRRDQDIPEQHKPVDVVSDK